MGLAVLMSRSQSVEDLRDVLAQTLTLQRAKPKAWVLSGLPEVWVQVGAKLILELGSPVCPSGGKCHSHK